MPLLSEQLKILKKEQSFVKTETTTKVSPRSAYYSSIKKNVRKYTTKRLVGSIEQLKIKKEQKEFSTLKFDVLPNEVIVHIFSYLRIVDLIKCGQVSKRLRIISKQKRRTRKAIARPVCPEKYQQGFSKFEALPNEVILNVFSYLPTEDLPKCRMISKRFRDISDVLHKMQPPNLWEIGPPISKERSSNSSAVCYDSYRRFL